VLAEKASRANRIAIAAPYDVALAFEELREEGTRGPRTQDEDSHGFSKLYHTRAGNHL
jgi:hypothetical protein